MCTNVHVFIQGQTTETHPSQWSFLPQMMVIHFLSLFLLWLHQTVCPEFHFVLKTAHQILDTIVSFTALEANSRKSLSLFFLQLVFCRHMKHNLPKLPEFSALIPRHKIVWFATKSQLYTTQCMCFLVYSSSWIIVSLLNTLFNQSHFQAGKVSESLWWLFQKVLGVKCSKLRRWGWKCGL